MKEEMREKAYTDIMTAVDGKRRLRSLICLKIEIGITS